MSTSADGNPAAIPTTSWSLILKAAQGRDTHAQSALTTLCQTYWYPLYAYLRRRGSSREEAEDLTQGFFAKLLEKNYLQDFIPSRGRFRSFILAALRHFVSNERDYARAYRRSGGKSALSLDFVNAERHLQIHPRDDQTPEIVFERDWALALLDRVLRRLREDWERADRGAHFAAMKVFLTGEPAGHSYRDVAQNVGMSESAVKVAVHRLRKRYRQVLQEEITATVDSVDEVAGEIQFLFGVLSR
jgi:RNA polymerase sigma-70 factor (ECF subfamily)